MLKVKSHLEEVHDEPALYTCNRPASLLSPLNMTQDTTKTFT